MQGLNNWDRASGANPIRHHIYLFRPPLSGFEDVHRITEALVGGRC